MGIYLFIGVVVLGTTCALLDQLKAIVKEMREYHEQTTNKLRDIKMAINDHTLMLCEVEEIEDFEE